MHLQRLYGSKCVRYLNVCADFRIIVSFLPRIALIFKMHLTITKRAFPKRISMISQPSHSVFLRSPFLLKALPSTNFSSPLGLPAARSTFSLQTSRRISSSLPSVVEICRSLPKTLNILWTGHFTTLQARSWSVPCLAETTRGMCPTNFPKGCFGHPTGVNGMFVNVSWYPSEREVLACSLFWKTIFERLNFLISSEKSKLQSTISSAHFSLRWSISYVFESMPFADTVLQT